MEAFGWSVDKLTDEYMKSLNNALKKYGITDMRSIALFMATAAHEVCLVLGC